MEELWRETSELMWQRPVLLLPVLAADLLGFLVNLGGGLLFRSVVLSDLQYHSALGGAPVRGQLSAAASQHATLLFLLITWPINFVRLALYATALIATAALVRAFLTRSRAPVTEMGAALQRHAGGVFSLALRAFAVYACAAAALDFGTKSLLAHGHKAVLTSGWLDTGAGVLVFAVLAWLVAPTAVQVLAQRYPSPALERRAQLFVLALGLVSLALGRFVATNLRSVHIASPAARYPLELTGSWIAALPYAVLFVALARIAVQVTAEADALPEHGAASSEQGVAH